MKQLRVSALLLNAIALVTGCQSADPQGAASPTARAEVQLPQSRPAPVAAESVQPPTGHRCEVYLRRDALGMAGPAPLGPNLDSLTHRQAAVSGTIDQVTDKWIVLRSSTGQLWIPRANVLMIEVLDR